jgi:hypothetical protein
MRARTPVHRRLTALFLLLVLMAAAQYLIKFLGNGLLDVEKQLFLFNVLIDLCLIAGMLWVASGLASWLQGAPRRARVAAIAATGPT